MKDIVGQELAVGNMIVFNPPRYKGLVTGEVIGFSPKMMRVKYTGPWVRTVQNGVIVDWALTSIYPKDAMKVDEQLAFIHTLSK